MDCPVCFKEPMIVLELSDIEVDYCLKCNGIWLDAGELELLLGNDTLSAKFLNSFAINNTTNEKKLKCPICDKKMAKIEVGVQATPLSEQPSKSKPVLIDRCINGHGIWFDNGELQEVIARGIWGKDDKVLLLLKDMFGKK